MAEKIATIAPVGRKSYSVEVRGDSEAFWVGRSLKRATAIVDLLNRGMIDDAHRLANRRAPLDEVRGG